MDVFDFITQEEIDGLPDDDPQAAFVSFTRFASRKLSSKLVELDHEENSYRQSNEWRQSYVNIIGAAAKRFQVEPFASMAVTFSVN